jgi:hypothetical protein
MAILGAKNEQHPESGSRTQSAATLRKIPRRQPFCAAKAAAQRELPVAVNLQIRISCEAAVHRWTPSTSAAPLTRLGRQIAPLSLHVLQSTG